jgi:hypothetical protein
MSKAVVLGFAVALFGAVTWVHSGPDARPPRRAGAPEEKAGRKIESPAARLAKKVEFPGISDPKTTLGIALDQLAKRYSLPLDVNEAAFKAAGQPNVLQQPIATTPIPRMKDVRLATVLRMILSRVPAEPPNEPVYLVRRDIIEITTEAMRRAEIWGAEFQGPFLPLVNAEFEKRPLAEALRVLADQTDFSVVLDIRAADKAKTPITASLTNLPLDSAVRVLADMAGLRAVRNDNALYITSIQNAVQLRPTDGPPVNLSLGLGGGIGGLGGLAGGVGAAGGLGALGMGGGGALGMGGGFAGQFGGGALGLTGGTPNPLVRPRTVTLDKRPLKEAVQKLLEGTGFNLVVDAKRTGDRASEPVTATLENVPLETCLRVLADLADLKLVVLDNVVYLTTKDNGRPLQREQDERERLRFRQEQQALRALGQPAAVRARK